MKTIHTLKKMKAAGEKISMLTVYDATFSHIINQVGADILLVGDSLGSVVQGHDSTLPVTIKDMCYHTECVRRGVSDAFVVADLPFMSYRNVDLALKNATKLMQAGANMVKLEGEAWLLPTIEALSQRGIPVCAHIGLTPQSVHQLGGYKVQGRGDHEARRLFEAAVSLEKAGASLLVVECIPRVLAKEMALGLSIPVIGIGAGPDCDGQVLVLHDMLGISGKAYKFSKNFMTESHDGIQGAIAAYHLAVKTGAFPSDEHSFE